MAPNSSECTRADVRSAPRASIYLAATLYCDGSAAPVKIRNISATGALLEGAIVPSEGSLVQLVRGGLIVHGLIAWSSEGRCGLKFSGSVDVQQWLSIPTNSEQQRVDEVVRLVKAGAVPLPIPPLAHQNGLKEATDSPADVANDLHVLGDLLASLGATLSSDCDLVARHGTALQSLDIGVQLLAAVAAVIDGSADLEIDATKLPGLRRSVDQALRQAARA